MSHAAEIITVPISIGQLAALRDAVSELDGLKGYAIATERARTAKVVNDAHTAIYQAAGEHAYLIYGNEPEAA